MRNRTIVALCMTAVILFVVAYAFAGAPAFAQPAAQATATPPASASDRTYVTLLPSASGATRLIVVVLKADGGVNLVTDPIGADPAVTQVGTWKASGDTVTLTITGDGTKTLDKPLILVFKRDDERLVATDYDKTVFGDKGFTLYLRDAVEAKLALLNRAYVSVDLNAGFPLDPFLVSVNGGGELDASLLNEKCKGYINPNPTLTVNWTGNADLVRAFTYSDADPMLVIQTPDGKFQCSDDSSSVLLDPQIEISKPSPGKYNVWVGSAAPKQLLPTILVLTARSDVSAGTFQLSDLVKRPAMPQAGSELPHALQAKVVTEALARYKGTAAGPLGASPLTQDVKSAGTIAAFDIDLGSAQCSGFIGDTPDFVFDVTGATDQLTVWLASKQDASLIIVGPQGSAYCNDDSGPGNTNPSLRLQKPAQGRYGVFVGRLNQDAPVEGTITVTSDPKATPPASNQAGGNN